MELRYDMAKYIVKKKEDGSLIFTLESEDQVLITGEPCATQTECLTAINLTRVLCRNYVVYTRNLSQTFKFYFVLSTVTGKVLGTSGFFETAVEMGKGIELMRKMGATEFVEVQG